ncbi:MAG TPA: hypothetical protein VNS33_07725 [Bradyrhizobium sp.]|nr:hypothetical protein [Bradyrhizobium sp.]
MTQEARDLSFGDLPFEDLPFGKIAAASPEALGLLMLKTDIHATRLDDRAQLAAVSDALADGVATAEDLRKRFPGLAPHEITRELQVPIVATDDDPMVGSIWRFAEYRSRPSRIVLYTRGLAPLEQALAGNLAKRLLGGASTQDVFVAHELYHHAEVTRAEIPISRRYQATLLQIASWRWRTGIATLSEIAAGSFAQTMLDLPCHPKVLDYVAWPMLRLGIREPVRAMKP